MITDPNPSQPVSAYGSAMGSVLLPPRSVALAQTRGLVARLHVARRRETYEMPRRQKALIAVGGCAAAAVVVLQAIGLATLF